MRVSGCWWAVWPLMLAPCEHREKLLQSVPIQVPVPRGTSPAEASGDTHWMCSVSPVVSDRVACSGAGSRTGLEPWSCRAQHRWSLQDALSSGPGMEVSPHSAHCTVCGRSSALAQTCSASRRGAGWVWDSTRPQSQVAWSQWLMKSLRPSAAPVWLEAGWRLHRSPTPPASGEMRLSLKTYTHADPLGGHKRNDRLGQMFMGMWRNWNSCILFMAM